MPHLERVPTGREPRIVVVDDEPSLRACIAMILREENYQVFEAPSAKEAMEHLREHGADLVLTDVKMPVASGLTLLSWLHAEPALAHIPVIFFTSAADEAQALKLGAYDYIHKPVRREQLLKRVFAGVCVGVMQPE